MNEIDYDVGGEDRAVLYTLNPRFDLWQAPTKSALEIEWECADGFGLLKQEIVANHPAYDGMVLSDALTAFMERIGWPAAMLDIDATPNARLGKKRTSGKFQFKPENGTMAIDFIRTLHDLFGFEYVYRFDKDGKFQFKEPSTASSRTFYMSENALADGYYVQRGSQVEFMMNEFYNELQVFGKDNRTGKIISAIEKNTGSQTDPNAFDYIGRRKLAVYWTNFNRQEEINWATYELWKKFGKIRCRFTFTTKFDPTLREGDFIQFNGDIRLWKITSMNTEVSPATMSRQGNVQGCQMEVIEQPQAT